jgi:signal transduction histidine kinase
LNKKPKISDDSDNLRFPGNEKDFSDQIINHSRSMISIINREYVYEKVNSTFCRAHQVMVDSIVGKSLEDIWGYDTFQNIIKSNIDSCFSGKTIRYEASFTIPQSGERYFEVVFRPLSTESGEITHLLAETFDINDLRQSKQAAIEKEEELRKLENRLLQAQKLEAIGALAGGIAHDFNNIMATISGYSEMLYDDLPKDSELSEKVSKIQGAVLKARSITNQILTFSRQVEQEKVPVSVSEVLKETIGFVNSSIPSNIVVKNRISDKKVNVLADPTQLFRVFLNLMTNMIQSMEESGGIMSVDMDVVKGKFVKHELNKDIVADEYVLLTFKDTGIGMEPSLIARIFEPFFTTREVGKGTGLGLSVIHGIITEMEGEILVSSKKQQGSVFYIYLPVSKKYPDFSGIKDGKKKILFITGNKHESRILSLALENTGFELIYISDRRNLIKVLAYINNRPDLIIYMSDSKQIQQGDLVSIFRRLKINTPCILITDPNQELSEEILLNSGIIKQQLIKPVSLKDIRNAIQISLK